MVDIGATASQLRDAAAKDVRAAQHLIDGGFLDQAAYLAGHAVEMAIKARWCVLNGYPRLTKAAVRGLKQDPHNLDRLLTLADGQQIVRARFTAIDWGALKSWGNEDRYRARGLVSLETAKARVAQSEAVISTLAQFELHRCLSNFAQQGAANGSISAFALLRNTQGALFDILIASKLLSDPIRGPVFRHGFVGSINALIPPDLRLLIGNYEFANAEHPRANLVYHLAAANPGVFSVTDSIVVGGPNMPRVRYSGLFHMARIKTIGLDDFHEAFILVAVSPE